ncbi:MAG: PilZ domain-containing protein [Terracidiphilus sp.]
MGSRRYCVYNQTNECFLSLGVAAARTAIERIKGMLEKRPPGNLEGYWLDRPIWNHVLAFFNARDLVYLDEGNKVIHVVESLPPRRFANFRGPTASVLALPPGTVESSQTQTGNQIVVCEAEEMVFRLRATSKPDGEAGSARSAKRGRAGETPARQQQAKDRRISPRRRWPHLAAFNAEGESLALHGVRDISTTGLYVVTQERWPIGTQVRLSLQRTDGLDDSSMIPTTVELRVSRWGEDGVALEFVKADPEHAALVSMHVR